MAHTIKQDGCVVAVPKHLHTAGTVSDARNAKLLGLTSVTNLGEHNNSTIKVASVSAPRPTALCQT